MISSLIIVALVTYISWELHYSPVGSDKETRRTILRIKMMQEDLKHNRCIKDHKDTI